MVSTENRKTNPTQDDAAPDPAAEHKPVEAIGVTQNNSGRVKFDDRGNAVWEWAVKTGSFAADVSTSRLKKLENTTLSLADDVPTPVEVAKPNPRGTAQGYSPYDSGMLSKKDAPRKKTDLRRLSEFYKLRQQHNRIKQDDE